MNAHCRIGKINLKNGGTIEKIRNTDLTVHSSECQFSALHKAHQYVKDGRAKMVAVAVIYDDGWTYSDFSKKAEVTGTQVLGAIELLRNTALEWVLA